jgi:lipoate-protein ligase B
MVIDLGLIEYEEAYAIQRNFVSKRRLGLIEDSLIIAEHHPVFTIGRSGSRENLLMSTAELLGKGVSVLRVDRGGDITFHGPGQIVAYPIVDLKNRDRDLHLYMRDLEEAAINFLRRYSIKAGKIAGRTGVWVDDAKIAFVGVAASDWVTYHGVSVNIDVDMRYFSMMHPCGIRGLAVTDLKEVLGRRVDIPPARKYLAEECMRIFGINSEACGRETASAMA